MKERFKKHFINTFIIMNLMMMLRAQLDSSAPLINFIYTPVTFVQNYFSMWRGWNMFAPNPLRSNNFIDAVVAFEDGSTLEWKFPRTGQDDLIGRYIWGERYRKYAVDGLRLDKNSHLWPDAARFVLKNIAKDNFRKIPTKVTLRRNWRNIDDWSNKFIAHKSIDNRPFKQYEFYTYKVAK
jgi:hypothetical protein